MSHGPDESRPARQDHVSVKHNSTDGSCQHRGAGVAWDADPSQVHEALATLIKTLPISNAS